LVGVPSRGNEAATLPTAGSRQGFPLGYYNFPSFRTTTPTDHVSIHTSTKHPNLSNKNESRDGSNLGVDALLTENAGGHPKGNFISTTNEMSQIRSERVFGPGLAIELFRLYTAEYLLMSRQSRWRMTYFAKKIRSTQAKSAVRQFP
jgi:hypothetical protein